MEATVKESKKVPKWLQRLIDLTWYEGLAWIIEAGLAVTFILITYDQFGEGFHRAGWVMILLTLLFAGPGFGLLLWYRPEPGSKFGKYDIGAIIAFAIWLIMLLYFIVWTVEFQPGFGNRL